MLSNISNIINIIALFQLLLLAYAVISNNHKRLSNIFLFLFLILNAFLIIISYSYSNEYLARNDFPIIFYFVRSTFLLLGPLLYLYTKSICYSNFYFKRIYWFHSVCFLILFSFFLIDYLIRVNSKLEISAEPLQVYTYLGFLVFWTFYLSQLLIYVIFSISTLNNYRRSLKKVYSNTDKINYTWLHVLLFVYLLHWFSDTLSPIFYSVGLNDQDWYIIANIFSTFTLLVFTTFTVIYGLKQSSIFAGIAEKPKYADSPLNDSNSEKYLEQLLNYIELSKPYLDSKLKITDLSNTLLIPEKQLSQLINQRLNKNFFDFINGYRITEAKKALSKDSNPNNGKNILEIAFMSGFNSKTAFNRAFKKNTGLTPSQYKALLT